MKEPGLPKALALTALLTILLSQAALAQENSTELKIESITTPIRAGESLEFSYLIGNNSGPACSATIQYWFEQGSERLVQGTDTVYLETGQQKLENASLIMPPGRESTRTFYLEMQCNQATSLASRIVHISTEIPKLPQFKGLEVTEIPEGEQVTFSYRLESTQGTVPVQLEEQITQDNNVVWANSQSVAVTGTTEIERLGPSLLAGSYKLTINASYGSETATMAREFRVGQAVPAAAPSLVTGALIAALLAIIAATGIAVSRLFSPKSHSPFFRAGKSAIKSRVCSVESETSGFPDELQLNRLLDDIGLSGKKRRKAALTSNRTQSEQTVRSCAVTYNSGKRDFETTVTATIRNNTNRDWKNVKVVLRLPGCLEQDITGVEADCQPEVLEGKPVLRFRIPQIGAMQSTTITYRAAKMISQAEANSIGLPAVIGLRKSKPLVITQVKSEEMAEAIAKGTKKPK